jgi:hypothetical protein
LRKNIQFCGLRVAGFLTGIFFAFVAASTPGFAAQTNDSVADGFSFIVAGDMRNFVEPTADGKHQFDGACEAIRQTGGGAFMILPGDFDPPEKVREMLDRHLGTNYPCYFAVGDHESQSAANMTWFRRWETGNLPHLVRRGPAGAEATTYSFDFGNSHFAVLNNFFDGKSDSAKPDLSEASMSWLEQDLSSNREPVVWVVSHKPIECLPDMDSGRLRHAGDSLIIDPERRKRFVALLDKYHVRALICGHTHGCSVEKVEGVWQADSGHARGAGDPGAPSTFLKIRVAGGQAWVFVYRADANGDNYQLRKTVEFN